MFYLCFFHADLTQSFERCRRTGDALATRPGTSGATTAFWFISLFIQISACLLFESLACCCFYQDSSLDEQSLHSGKLFSFDCHWSSKFGLEAGTVEID